MSHIDEFTLWDKILQDTKGKISAPLWNAISQGVVPCKLEGNIFTLYPLHNFVCTILTNDEQTLSILSTSASSIVGSTIQFSVSSIESSGEEHVTNETVNTPPPQRNENPQEIVEILPPIQNSTTFINENFSIPTTEDKVIDNTPIYDAPVVLTSNKQVESNPTEEMSLFNNEPTVVEDSISLDHTCRLNPEYTFENFIQGGSNRLAVAASYNVADNPNSGYNPLFIYGNAGLGKTHLMHAIGHRIQKNFKDMKIVCIPSEIFLNDLIACIRHNKRDEFRKIYRNVDILLVDDIQFIQGKESMDEEFFHTFNELLTDNKQIVLTSDTLPKDMNKLSERLRSRFESGYVASIELPDLETRIAILQAKAEEDMQKNPGLKITHDALTFIASKIFQNIRSMEGAYNKTIHTALIEKVNLIDETYTYNAIRELLSTSASRQLSISLIQECVSEYYHLKLDQLLSKKRNKHLVYPRQIAMYLCRHLMNASYPAIADSFDKKDHTTIIHGYEKIAKDLKDNEDTKINVDNIISLIKSKSG